MEGQQNVFHRYGFCRKNTSFRYSANGRTLQISCRCMPSYRSSIKIGGKNIIYISLPISSIRFSSQVRLNTTIPLKIFQKLKVIFYEIKLFYKYIASQGHLLTLNYPMDTSISERPSIKITAPNSILLIK